VAFKGVLRTAAGGFLTTGDLIGLAVVGVGVDMDVMGFVDIPIVNGWAVGATLEMSGIDVVEAGRGVGAPSSSGSSCVGGAYGGGGASEDLRVQEDEGRMGGGFGLVDVDLGGHSRFSVRSWFAESPVL